MAQTTVIVPGHSDLVLPGAKTVDQVIAFLGADIPGLAGMQANRVENGENVTITFSVRTGTKGL